MKTGLGFLLALTAVSPVVAQKRMPPPPIITNVPPPSERYGQWSVTSINNTFIAGTTNSSGSFFGIACSKSCGVIFNPKLPCKDGAKYQALINSPSSAYAATLTCRIIEDRNVLATDMTSELIDSMEIGGELGIAFPMQSGTFQVTRFSLTGALKASVRAYSLSNAGKADDSEEGLRDQTL